MTTTEHTGDAVERYLNSIGREPLMTPEEEIRLGRIVKEGEALKKLERDLTPDERRLVRRSEKAKQRFVKANLRLVVFVAKRYHAKTIFLEMLDLVQEASLGLMRAVELYDPERGYKFSTYAYWWIRQAVTRSINSSEWVIKRPTGVAEMAVRLAKCRGELAVNLGRSPTLEELAEAVNVKPSELELLAERGTGCASLHQSVNGVEDSMLIDLIADPNAPDTQEQDQQLEVELRRHQLEASLNTLSEQERYLVERRYGLVDGVQVTYAQLAKESGVSRERVRQVTDKAIVKLRWALGRTRAGTPSNEVTKPSTKEVAPSSRSKETVELKFPLGTTPSQALLCA